MRKERLLQGACSVLAWSRRGSSKPRDSDILARRMREHCQDKQVSNRAALGLEETGRDWKGAMRKKNTLRCKVTARNRREQVIFVSEVSWGRHEGIQP